ncbi:MAG: hypothetical protein WC628_04570 [Candidatus Omnitrophota bacterium]
MNKLPSCLKKYFWDVEFEKVDLRAYPRDVLTRLLEYGDEKAINWMKENFTKEQIADVLFHFRIVSPKSANFWALIFGIDRKRILCLQKPYLEIRKAHWPY